MSSQQASGRDAGRQAPHLTNAAKVVAVLLAVSGSIVAVLGLLLAGRSPQDTAMGRGFAQLGWIAAGVGLVHVVTAVLALVARWFGRLLVLMLGTAGCLLSLVTVNGGGVISLIGLIAYGTVVTVFAFRWETTLTASAHLDPG